MKDLTDIQLAQLRKVIEDVKDRFTRDIDQALMRQDLQHAVASMAGRNACDRVWQEIERVTAMVKNAARIAEFPPQRRRRG